VATVRSDTAIGEDVLDAVAGDPRTEPWNLAADVQGGVVYFQGDRPR